MPARAFHLVNECRWLRLMLGVNLQRPNH